MQQKERESLSNFLKKGIVPLILIVSFLVMSFLALHNVSLVQNVSGVNISSSNIGVYWNAEGTSPVSTINWGNVSLGSEKDVSVYVKNLGPDALILSMNTSAWNPSAASLKMYLCWDYNGEQVGSGSIVKVTLKLFVSPDISGVHNFSFDINVGVGLQKSPDINGDGIVNVLDITILAMAWQTSAGEPKYDYRCDLNNDGVVNVLDITILAMAWQT